MTLISSDLNSELTLKKESSVSNLFLTLMIAFIAIIIAIACLAVGWLITGKTKIARGACGRDPTKGADENCSTSSSCELCSSEGTEDRHALHKGKDQAEQIAKL